MTTSTQLDKETIEGIAERVVYHPGNRYGILIDGEWYNGFGDGPEEGKKVVLAARIVEKGGHTFHNVDSWTQEEEESEPDEAPAKETTKKASPKKKEAAKPEKKPAASVDYYDVLHEEQVRLTACIEFVEETTGKSLFEFPESVRLTDCLYIQTNKQHYFEEHKNGGR